MQEKIVAAIGGCLAIYLVYLASLHFTGEQGVLLIVPSMGAATVLLFAVPHGQLSTPWSLFAGNLLSAFAGVSTVKFLGTSMISAAIAVGSAIALMHVFRCIHPPGGATALAAVISGDAVVGLGYWYLLTPTLLNCAVLFAVALVFNNCFSWRRYPFGLMHYKDVKYHPDTMQIKPHHIHQAIERSEIVVDASDEQIKHIVDLADEIMRTEAVSGNRQ